MKAIKTSESSVKQAPVKNTEGVSIVTGDPKKAILKLSGPMIVAMLLMSIYNLINAVWVAGLGGDALAAIGFVTPVYMILVGLGNGLSAGATSAIARYIGANNKKGANNTAIHTLILTVIISIIVTALLEVFLVPIMSALGAGSTTGLAVEFGRVMFAGTILMLFTNAAYGILRAEGDVKRTMYAMGLSAVINIILDPILIYYAGMGIAGAAWGTLISLAFVSMVILYWFLKKKDTFVSLSPSNFTPDRTVIRNILGVGLPAGSEFLIISILIGILNGILVMVGGTDAVAVYSAGWRVVMMAIIPIISVGTATIAIVGAAYGSRKYENISIAHNYSIKVGFLVALVTGILTYIFAYHISLIFAYSSETMYLVPTIAAFLQVMCLFYFFMPPGVMSSSIFQGVGKGTTSLVFTVLREIVFVTISAYILAIVLGYGEQGVWWGIVIGNIIGSIVAYVCARFYISRLKSQQYQDMTLEKACNKYGGM